MITENLSALRISFILIFNFIRQTLSNTLLLERSYTSKTVEKLAKSNQRKSSKSCKKTTSEIVPQLSHICSLFLGHIFEIITWVNQSVYSFYLLNCQTKSFYKVWWRTSRQSRWLRQSWSQGRDHKSHQSLRWSRARSSWGISQTLQIHSE